MTKKQDDKIFTNRILSILGLALALISFIIIMFILVPHIDIHRNAINSNGHRLDLIDDYLESWEEECIENKTITVLNYESDAFLCESRCETSKGCIKMFSVEECIGQGECYGLCINELFKNPNLIHNESICTKKMLVLEVEE
jgi:hypothetical protein